VSLGNVLAVQLITGNDLLPTSSIRARPVMRKMSASTSVSTKWMGGFFMPSWLSVAAGTAVAIPNPEPRQHWRFRQKNPNR